MNNPATGHWRAAICGAAANVVECCLMHPLDTVKTRLQLRVSQAGGLGIGGIWNTFRCMVQHGGAKGIYRGLLPAAGMQAPRGMVKFGVNSSVLGQLQQGRTRTNHGIVWQAGGATIAGFTAGSVESLFITPFELLKVRLQAANNIGVYRNTFDVARQVIWLEGLKGLWLGLTATVIRNGSWNGAYFGTIHTLRCLSTSEHTTNMRCNASSSFLILFGQGTLAGAFGSLFSNPVDVCKTRIQNTLISNQSHGLLDIGKMMARIYSSEGPFALYKGFCAKVLRLGPGGGILLVAFEAADRFYGALEL